MEAILKDAFEMASKLSPREQNLLAEDIFFILENEMKSSRTPFDFLLKKEEEIYSRNDVQKIYNKS